MVPLEEGFSPKDTIKGLWTGALFGSAMWLGIVELDLFDRRRPHRAFYRCVSLACAANHQLVPCYCVHCACSRPLRSNLALARGHQNAKIFQRLAAPERGRRSSEGRREEGNHLYGVMLCMLKHDPLIACRMNNAERLNQQCVC